MLTSLRFNNYKSFGLEIDIPLRKVTIFIGKNNSGKTAAARSLAVWSELTFGRTDVDSGFPLTARGMSIGSSTGEIVHQGVAHGAFRLGFSARTWSEETHIDFELQNFESLAKRSAGYFVDLTVSEIHKPEPKVSFGVESVKAAQAGNKRLWAVNEFGGQGLNVAEGSFRGLAYLAAVRPPIQPIYGVREMAAIVQVGDSAPYALHDDAELLANVSAWYESALGAPRLQIDSEANAFLLRLGHANLASSGQGLQQVLPVVTAIERFGSREEGGKLLVIEEPELHLHPAAQGALADLLARFLHSQSERQIVLETHSENLLLGLRRLVAEGEIDHRDIGIVWFEPSETGTSITPIDIRPDGSVSFWPVGVFSENLEQVRAIARASRR